MSQIYRVTPLRKKWIVQRVADRKQIGKSFIKKTEASAYELELLAKAPQAKGKPSKKTIFQAYEKFAAYKNDEAQPETGISKHSAGWYDTDYRLRISKFMPKDEDGKDILLSDFDQLFALALGRQRSGFFLSLLVPHGPLIEPSVPILTQFCSLHSLSCPIT